MPTKTTLTLSSLLAFIGKPLFIIFIFGGTLIIAFLHFIKVSLKHFFTFINSLQLPKLSLPPLKLPTLPKIQLSTPQFNLKFKKPNKPVFMALFLFSSILGLFYQFILKDLPNPHLLSTSLPSLSTKIYDRHGELLYQIYRQENRTLIKLNDLPKHLINATIAAEDKSFYQHMGISPTAIFRALYHNLVVCKLKITNCSVQGASTLTQQLVKNALLSPEKTLTRKLKEAVLAIWLETIFNKDEILELYFNYVPYGGTAYGIEEGAHYYFNKSAKNLNLAESALLAGLPIAPTTLSPYGINPYLAKHRQNQVLDRMVNQGFISSQEANLAKVTPLIFATRANNILAPHFVMYVQDKLVKKFGENMVHRGGLEVVTSLDLSMQKILEQAITNELNKLTHLKVSNGAGIILDAHTGEILAMVGSKDFFDLKHDGQVNITISQRQPGSSIKPLTYALAFMNGLSPSTRIDDVPTCFNQIGQKPYCPKNYDGKFHGSVTLRTALASSYNIPATKLLNSLGVNQLVTLGKSLGITTWDNPSQYGLALTLGGGAVKLLELTNAYATFARGGSYLPTSSILSVTNHVTLPRPIKPQPKQIIPPSVAYQITSVLSDNYARSPAFGYRSVLNIPSHQVAVKTGTSNDLRDNWAIGYTSDYVVGIWVGNNDNTPMSRVVSGITGASPIWHNTMIKLLKNSPPHRFPVPANLIKVNLSCTQTPYYDYFVPGTEPHVDCSPKPDGDIL